MSRLGFVRVLTCYDREDGEYLGERVLAVPLAELRAMFGMPADDDMMGAYAVGQTQASALERSLGVAIDVAAQAWYVESYEMDDPG